MSDDRELEELFVPIELVFVRLLSSSCFRGSSGLSTPQVSRPCRGGGPSRDGSTPLWVSPPHENLFLQVGGFAA